MGCAQLNPGSSFAAASTRSSQTCGRCTLLRATAETPGYLGNRGLVKRGRRRYNSTADGGLFLQEPPAQGHSRPILCFLEIKTKGCFSMFKEKKKKKVKTKHNTSQFVTPGLSLLPFLSLTLSFHASYPYWLFCLQLFSLPIRDICGRW